MYFSDKLVKDLSLTAQQLRLDALDMIYSRTQGHIGGAFSMAEIITALFFYHMNIKPDQPYWDQRDRFILGKGHACATLYAALARRGFFKEKELKEFGRIGSILQGHPDMNKTAGIDMSTGCLGHALPIAAGLGLAARLKRLCYKTYALLGDGECQAGIVWEGAMFISKYNLSNIITIIDYNNVQNDGPTHEIMPLEPFADKWKAFGFETFTVHGHNMYSILEVLAQAREIHANPVAIIAHTIKGKGVSFMENTCEWHGGAPTKEQYELAKIELEEGMSLWK